MSSIGEGIDFSQEQQKISGTVLSLFVCALLKAWHDGESLVCSFLNLPLRLEGKTSRAQKQRSHNRALRVVLLPPFVPNVVVLSFMQDPS